VGDNPKHKLLSFEEYWRASKAWEQRGLSLGTGRALVNAGFLTIDDLRSVPYADLAAIPRVGTKSLAVLTDLMRQRSIEQSTGVKHVEQAADHRPSSKHRRKDRDRNTPTCR
jgi:hypothetical protein